VSLDPLMPSTPLHQTPQYNSEACEEMRKIILDSKAHGEALSREFDGGRSQEQIGSKRIIRSLALLLSKLQRTGSDYACWSCYYFCTPVKPPFALSESAVFHVANRISRVAVVSPIIATPGCSSCNSIESPFASFSSINFDFYLIT
jgi:hypothetical protein